MKKRYDDLTISEIENLVKCTDKNGKWLCKKGCCFSFNEGVMCAMRAFYNHLWEYCEENNLVSENEDGEWEIEIESEDTE